MSTVLALELEYKRYRKNLQRDGIVPVGVRDGRLRVVERYEVQTRNPM